MMRPICVCIGCGCDDLHACCDDVTGRPCSWIILDIDAQLGVCSGCTMHLERWHRGDRTIEQALP